MHTQHLQDGRAPARKIVVFATSFLDTPVASSPDSGKARAQLESAAEHSGFSVEYRCERDPRTPLDPSEFEGVAAVIADLERYDRDLLEAVGQGNGGSLAVISRYGTGVSNIDLEAAADSGVLVANAPGANAAPTAEWTLATILSVAGGRILNHGRAARGLAKTTCPRLDLRGRTLGIIGTGSVGRRLVELVDGFRMDVIAFTPHPDHEWANAHGVRYTTFEEVIECSDVLSLHASADYQLVGEAEIARMKPTAMLINCARDHLVDTEAVYRAVSEDRLWGYGLDEVWTRDDLPLRPELNIVVSPHIGSDSDYGKEQMQLVSAKNITAWLEGGRPPHPVVPSNSAASTRHGTGS